MSVDSRKPFRHSDTASDSDGSDNDSVSLASSQVEGTVATIASSPPHGKTRKKRNSHKSRQEWDVVEGLKDGQKCEEMSEKYQGYLMKRRKWPLKGWHKRFFVLDRGILTYAKSSTDIQKGKYHGIMDIGLAVITFKRQGQRIDIDAEEQVHHIKVKDKAVFEDWLQRLRHHRLCRQHELVYGTKDTQRLNVITSPAEEMPTIATANLPELALYQPLKKDVIRQSSFKAGQGRVVTWLLDSAGFEQSGKCKDLQTCEQDLAELRDMLEKIQALPVSTDSGLERMDSYESDVIVGKKRGIHLSKHRERKSDSYTGVSCLRDYHQPHQTSQASVFLQSPSPDRLHVSASNPNLLHYANGNSTASLSSTGYSSSGSRGHLPCDSASADNYEARLQDLKLRENYLAKAESVHSRLKELMSLLSTERERLKTTLEQQDGDTVAALKHSLAEVQKQNSDLRARLARIHADSLLADGPTPQVLSPLPTLRISRSHDKANLAQSLSLDSFSLSEYYDAEENLGTISDSSTEPSDEEASSEISEDGNETDHTTGGLSVSEMTSPSVFATGRRSKLPIPKPESPDVSLWNLLYRNIGKDLTKISMPVTLNEPLSMLQRLCEELEYSELLDKAAEYDDPYQRMIYVAAFAVSSYASSYYREGHKPFNPLLGETYECIREDKGWRFIAEQVCHHPPVSACHCESRNFKLWQDVRIKTKFWGKSMEIQPVGHVHVVLPKYRDHYRWNKVTTCVHNLLGGQRWADQYGEMTITNGNTVCKLTFTKGSNNASPKRYEVFGSINTSDGKVVHNIFGKWNESFFCGHATSAKCIWRPGTMPADYELYYGFTRFAIELNELDPDMAKYLPPTDSRFRPDQRLLEEGKIAEAESEKHRLENSQRDRRKARESSGDEHKPLWFKKTLNDSKTEVYEYTNKYWEARKDPGFAKMSFIPLF